MRAKIVDLLAKSVIMQGVLTLAVAATLLYLIIVGREGPDQLWNAFWTILGFFFGSKVTASSFKSGNPDYY